jgi:hypothetical protein
VVAALIPTVFKNAIATARESRASLLFLRGFCVLYAIGFLSFLLQAKGLVGEHGILPATELMKAEREMSGAAALFRIPSIFWLGTSDGMLSGVAIVGVATALAGVAGYLNAISLGALWFLYLSYVGISPTFFQDPSDLLLLETGFLAIFAAEPLGVTRRKTAVVPVLVVWLLRLLLVRITVGACVAAVRTEACGSAHLCLLGLQVEPTLFSSAVQSLLRHVSRGGVYLLLHLGLLVPWGLFGPRRLRHACAAILVVAYAVAALYGNSGSQSYVGILLAVACFDDTFLATLPRFLRWQGSQDDVRALSPSRRLLLGVVTLLVVGLAVALPGAISRRPPGAPASLEPFHLVNAYEIAQSAEPDRLEIVFEGTSDDAAEGTPHWLEYQLPCKPGALGRWPCLPSPYSHRLDTRLSEAALGDFRRAPWLVVVVDQLLRGNETVTHLFSQNPFGGTPPRFVRVERFRYRFDTSGRRGVWWNRELVPGDEYIRPFSLQDPALFEYLTRRGWLRP